MDGVSWNSASGSWLSAVQLRGPCVRAKNRFR